MTSIDPRTWAFAAVALSAVLAASPASSASPGYLPPGTIDIIRILPPAPVEGEARYDADRAIFKATRRFAGSPRWTFATRDVKLSPADMMRDFSCAAGIILTPQDAPHVDAMVERAIGDTARASNVAKNYFKRLRPFHIDEGPTCQPTAELGGGYDYPSGHATRGWTWATLLAELLPDRASAILARGRAFGESRVVCGVHNASAVEAGRLTAASVLPVVQSQPAFRSDFKAAKTEIDALRTDPRTPHPQGCAAEAGLVATPVY